MAVTQAADHRKLSASASTAYGAVRAWIRKPATDGPAIWLTDSLACSRELPATSCSRPTSWGR